MDELLLQAEAKDMQLAATRGEEAQGSGRSFRRQAERSSSGLCADDGELLMTIKVKD